jgi:hypothetical protein
MDRDLRRKVERLGYGDRVAPHPAQGDHGGVHRQSDDDQADVSRDGWRSMSRRQGR